VPSSTQVHISLHENELPVGDRVPPPLPLDGSVEPGITKGEKKKDLRLYETLAKTSELLPTLERKHIGTVLFQRMDRAPEKCGSVPRVGIREEDELPFGSLCRLVTSPWLAEPSRRERFPLQHSKCAGSSETDSPGQLPGSVGRAIVHDENGELGIVLGRERIEASLDIPSLVPRGDDDGDRSKVRYATGVPGRFRRERPRLPKCGDEEEDEENPGETGKQGQPYHQSLSPLDANSVLHLIAGINDDSRALRQPREDLGLRLTPPPQLDRSRYRPPILLTENQPSIPATEERTRRNSKHIFRAVDQDSRLDAEAVSEPAPLAFVTEGIEKHVHPLFLDTERRQAGEPRGFHAADPRVESPLSPPIRDRRLRSSLDADRVRRQEVDHDFQCRRITDLEDEFARTDRPAALALHTKHHSFDR
jgi:hypothetical protein